MKDIINSLDHITDNFLLKLNLNVSTWHQQRIWYGDLYSFNFFICVVFAFIIACSLLWRRWSADVVVTTIILIWWPTLRKVNVSRIYYSIIVCATIYWFDLQHWSNRLLRRLLLFRLSCVSLSRYRLSSRWPCEWNHLWILHHLILILRVQGCILLRILICLLLIYLLLLLLIECHLHLLLIHSTCVYLYLLLLLTLALSAVVLLLLLLLVVWHALKNKPSLSFLTRSLLIWSWLHLLILLLDHLISELDASTVWVLLILIIKVLLGCLLILDHLHILATVWWLVLSLRIGSRLWVTSSSWYFVIKSYILRRFYLVNARV